MKDFMIGLKDYWQLTNYYLIVFCLEWKALLIHSAFFETFCAIVRKSLILVRSYLFLTFLK